MNTLFNLIEGNFEGKKDKGETLDLGDLRKECLDEVIYKLDIEKKKLEQMGPFQQYGPYSLTEKMRWRGRDKGVYIIRYQTGRCMVVGESGCLSNRRTRYSTVYKKGGKGIVHASSTSDCQAARKMYNYDDSGLDAFDYSYIYIPNESLRKVVEERLIQILKPLCNTEHMAGK